MIPPWKPVVVKVSPSTTLSTGIAGQFEQQSVVPHLPSVVPMPKVIASGCSVALPGASRGSTGSQQQRA